MGTPHRNSTQLDVMEKRGGKPYFLQLLAFLGMLMIGWQQMVGPANPPPKSLLQSWLLPNGEEETGKLADSAVSPCCLLPTVPATAVSPRVGWHAGMQVFLAPPGQAPGGVSPLGVRCGGTQRLGSEVTACSLRISPAS